MTAIRPMISEKLHSQSEVGWMNKRTDGQTGKLYAPILSHKNLHKSKLGSLNMYTQERIIFHLFRNYLLSFVEFLYMFISMYYKILFF